MNRLIPILLSTLLLEFGCTNQNSSTDPLANKLQPTEIKNPVQIVVLKETNFQKELISNGKLNARQKSVLKFDAPGEVEELRVKNGDRVNIGEAIAMLKQDKFRHSLSQAELQLAKTFLELEDYLLGFRYQVKDSANIPESIFATAKLRSGYSAALIEQKSALRNLKNSVLYAPFTGIVANIHHQVFEQVSPSDEFCTLIDNSAFLVEFSVLETEIGEISPNKAVKVFPFVNETKVYHGRITEINPVVDEFGHVKVKALIENTNGLIEGMNVKVKIETSVPGQLVVPKSAVLQRQDQQVLFKYTGGTAFWTYVQTGLENSSSFTVIASPDKSGSLMAGDTVIISGNLNLAHGSEVEIQK